MVSHTIADVSGSVIFDGFAKGWLEMPSWPLAASEVSQTETPVRRQSHYASIND